MQLQKHKDEDAEETGTDESEAQTHRYIVFKAPKATTAPHATRHLGAVVLPLPEDKTGRAT